MQLTEKCPKYTYRKDGVYYFSKAVPKDLLDLYCKPRIAMCLELNGAAKDSFQRPTPLLSVTSYQ
ncbi:MAG: DUF6538 domain-containing protein [SAR324 cluster bacterium]|nr:DUF6538 domain-containing protein [SAR324 cluster bacterium]